MSEAQTKSSQTLSGVRRPPPKTHVTWRHTYRIIAARYPPVALFERVADPADWEALLEVESLTNERIRDAVGSIRLVPLEERVSGPGAGWVMGAFTHIGWPSRFSDGSYGVYYTARSRDCAVAETAYHTGRFLAATSEPPCELDMRVLVAGIDAVLHDLRGDPRRFQPVHDPNDYTASQALGRTLHTAGSSGIVYRSVRLASSECAAAFRPRAVRPLPRGDTYLLYHWDGERIDRYWDYAADRWIMTSSSDAGPNRPNPERGHPARPPRRSR